MHEFDIDYSELMGWKMECIPECGLCCLCQAEVLPLERQFFRQNHPRQLVKKDHPHNHLALALKKGKGSCVFLQDRRCSIYHDRPAFCRQFPFHFHVGERVKVELDLSCRGLWTGQGQEAIMEAKELATTANDRLARALKQSVPVYREFHENCHSAGVYADPVNLRAQTAERLDRFTDLGFLGQLMLASYDDPEMDLREMDDKEFRYDYQELEEAAREAALGSMASQDPVNIPVYCDGKWSWNLFMAHKDGIDWKVLTDEGDLQHRGFVESSQVGLLPLRPEGEALLRRYVGILNQRDSFLGNVYHLVDNFGYEDHVSNVYFGSLSVTVVDLIWRASMLSHFFGHELGQEGVREAIIFYDMDRLDAPSIGAFV
ncbi:MAG: YkgJ family cysteine cluster protein [Candidatus Methanomethylophilaceae archaeon]|nr:YkgJ family cysteine cluster protein [Candidatus Methanomethylophilaceae archaeon]